MFSSPSVRYYIEILSTAVFRILHDNHGDVCSTGWQNTFPYISGGSRGGAQGVLAPPPTLFWVKKKKSQREEKLTGQAKQPPPLAQGLDPPLLYWHSTNDSKIINHIHIPCS